MHTNPEGLLLSNKQSKTDRKMLCSKMLPSSDSGTERGARLSLGFLFILSLNTADSLSPFQLPQLLYICHSVSPSVCLSRLLALALPAFSEGSDASNEEGAGVRRGTTRNTGNGKFEWSYHLFCSCWSKPISCFALWSLGWDATMQRWAMWLMCLLYRVAVWATSIPWKGNLGSLFLAFV